MANPQSHEKKEPDKLEIDSSIQNIISALKHYQTILNDENFNDLICQYFQESNKTILQDYVTILKTYLNNTVQQNHATFEQIYDIMCKDIKCDIKNCKQYSRNNRNREKESIKSNIDKDDEIKAIFYTDLLDTIHCYFLHSYDIGFRMKYSELKDIYQDHTSQQTKQNIDDTSDDLDNSKFLSNHIDDGMNKFNAFLRNKRESLREIRGAKRTENNKFMTNVNKDTLIVNDEQKEDEDGDNKEDIDEQKAETDDKMSSFSFGYRYYYWKQKKFRERWYIPKQMCKYKCLKDELLNNLIFTLEVEAYNIALEKATQYAQSSYIQKLKTNNILCRYYGVEKNSIMDIEHILSLVLYTDFDQLSFYFSSTFRRQDNDTNINKSVSLIHKELKERNAEYWHWSKALRETVELWGIPLNSKDNKYKIFYHGTSYLIFDKLVAKFSSPTSTTSSIEVASIFARENGIILELEQYTGYGSDLRFFDVNFISTFSSEDEKLFFGGKKQLRLGSIRNIAEKENYRIFIKALTICQIAIRGMNNTVIKNIGKRDYGIIDRLCKHQQRNGIYGEYKNAFPEYVNKLFKSFAENQTTLSFSFDNIKKYIGIIKIFGFVDIRGLLQFDYLLKTFINCEYITMLECTSNSLKIDPYIVTFTRQFADKLLEICERINEDKQTKIQNILYRHNIEFNQKKLKKFYEDKFAQKNWTLLFQKDAQVKGSKKKNKKTFCMTLKKGYSGYLSEEDKIKMVKSSRKQHSLFLHHYDGMAQMQKSVMTDVHLQDYKK